MTDHIVIIGYYGFGNAGDEAILSCLLDDLAANFPQGAFSVISGDAATTARTHRVEAVPAYDIAAVVKAVHSADLVIVGGGGLLHDYWGADLSTTLTPRHSQVPFYCGPALLAATLGKPVVGYALGVGPLTSAPARQMVTAFGHAASALTVRDPLSATLLKELGIPTSKVQLTADPAWSLVTASPAEIKHIRDTERLFDGRPTLGLALRNWNQGVDSAWEQAVMQGVREFAARHDCSVLLLPFQTNSGELEDDRTIARRVARGLNPDRVRILTGRYSPGELAGLIGQCRALVGMRLHSLIFSFITGTPAIGLAYDPKVSELLRGLGYPDNVLELPSLQAEDVIRRLEVFWTEQESISGTMQAAAQKQMLLARSTASITREVWRGASQRHAGWQHIWGDILVNRILGTDTRAVQPPPLATDANQPASGAAKPDSGRQIQRYAQVAEDLRIRLAAQAEAAARIPEDAVESLWVADMFDILCFSIIDWNFRFQRPQQLMLHLAQSGHRVFYLNPSAFLPPDDPVQFRVREVASNVYEIELACVGVPNTYGPAISGPSAESLLNSLDALRRAVGLEHVMAMVQVSAWSTVAQEARRRWAWPLIYDCMDDWAHFPGSVAEQRRDESALVEACDLLLVSSRSLEAKWAGRAAKCLRLPNGVDVEFYAQHSRPNDLLRGLTNPIVGYFGAIADWFDIELVRSAASQRPEWNFVLLGDVFDVDVSGLRALPNVHLLGQQPYADMPLYLYHFDACLIPFKINALTRATDPVKFYEYISAGKPVVATTLPELEPYRELLYLARNPGEFVDLLDAALAEQDVALIERRRAFAQANTWHKRVEALEAAMAPIADRGEWPRPTPASKATGLRRGGSDTASHMNLQSRQWAMLRAEQRSLAAELDDLDRQVSALQEDLRVQVGGRDHLIRNLQAELQTKVSERDQLIRALQSELHTKVRGRDASIAGLHRELHAKVGERDQLIAGLQASAAELHRKISDNSAQLAERDAAVNSLRSRLAADEQELFTIQTSRYWRLMSYYWRAQGWAIAGYESLRNLARRLLPSPVWRPLVRYYHRLRPVPATVPPQPGANPPEAALPSEPRPGTYDVVCFPIIDWRFRFQRPQQLITQLARAGHRCFYFSTTFSPAGLQRQPLAENVDGLTLPGPASLRLYRDELPPAVRDGMLAALDEWRLTAEVVDAVLLVQLPFWAPLAEAARERWGWKIVYDLMDEHAGFSTNSPDMLRQEDGLLRRADLVLATSAALETKAYALSRNVLRLPNAGDFAHFSQNGGPDPLPGLHGPVIGYYGAISEWFDADLVAAVARRRPEWQFVLVGDTYGADVASLRALPNVRLAGEKPYADLPAYLHRFDVACIPFKLNDLTRATQPVKFFEYLSAGKPVVAVELPELEPHRALFYPARGAAKFETQIAAALAESAPERRAARVAFARANTWEHRGTALQGALRTLYGEAVVVVVSYNNLDYLRLCLDSVWAHTTWPNFRVVVVDNGSTPDVVAYLRAAQAAEPRLKVIFNESNLGFARANNLGLASAGDCAYNVLLNNDAVVTRGWLSTLIRHLAEPGVALVGPVTNWAGNEAQVDLGYADLDEMHRAAAHYTRVHTGLTFDIPMLAMYCLAFRRELLDQIGPLDERFGLGMFEDDDFALRARRAGGRVVCAEDVFVHHWGRASFGRLPQEDYDRLFIENRRKFEEKWGEKWVAHQARAR